MAIHTRKLSRISGIAISWLSAGNICANAQNASTPRVLERHVTSDEILHKECFGFTARVDNLQTRECDIVQEDINQQVELNSKMNALCAGKYSSFQFMRDITEDERRWLKSAIQAVNKCQDYYVQYSDICSYQGMANTRNVQLNYWSSVAYVIENVEGRVKKTDMPEASLDLISKGPALEREFSGGSEDEVEDASTIMDADDSLDIILDAWKNYEVKRLKEMYDIEHGFKLPVLASLGSCK